MGYSGGGGGDVSQEDLNESLLGTLTSANFNSTSDQAITIDATNYILRRIVVTNPSINLDTAAGGFYTGAGKTGVTVVAAAQTYTTLALSTRWMDLTLAAGPAANRLSSTTIFLSLTSPQGEAATADVYLFGHKIA